MDTEKEEFLNKYQDCAEKRVLEGIWKAKVENLTKLPFGLYDDVKSLTPLSDIFPRSPKSSPLTLKAQRWCSVS